MRFASKAVSLTVILGFAVAALPGQPTGAKRRPDVPYEPSTPGIVSAMLKLADVKKGDVVYDLGCGDGRIVIAAARDFGATAVGVDIDPVRTAEARKNARKARVTKRVTFRTEDLFEADIKDATVMMLYLWPEVNLRLRPKLWRDLKPGTRVVSHSHTMGDWKAEKEIEVEGHKIYFWTIPAKAPGTN